MNHLYRCLYEARKLDEIVRGAPSFGIREGISTVNELNFHTRTPISLSHSHSIVIVVNIFDITRALLQVGR